ncbi:MAG: hypothetical protein IPK97_08425 [Ahniella sp.]|nr:hypothetical protein [Ahniella sp.]
MEILFSFAFFLGSAQAADLNDAVQQAVERDFDSEPFSVWSMAMGDLNRDGLSDAALILVGRQTDFGRPERFVVYLGTAQGRFDQLSRSAQFCEVRDFYELEIREGSVFVNMGHTVGEPIRSTTLQFRLEQGVSDLRLIGEEYLEEYSLIDSVFRGSINYLTGKAVYSRANDLGRKEVTRRLRLPAIHLRGFDCSHWRSLGSEVVIDESLMVKE